MPLQNVLREAQFVHCSNIEDWQSLNDELERDGHRKRWLDCSDCEYSSLSNGDSHKDELVCKKFNIYVSKYDSCRYAVLSKSKEKEYNAVFQQIIKEQKSSDTVMTKKRFLELEEFYKSQKDNVVAVKLLADLYLRGLSKKEHNIEKAFPYYKIAADMGEWSSAGIVGISLLSGDGCKQNDKEGFRYLKMAVDGGLNVPGMQLTLGNCYFHGIGCNENNGMAAKYYRMAALQNDAEAQYKCGCAMFLDENNSYEHSDEYLHWWCCAYLNGNQDATNALNEFMNDKDPSFRQTVQWEIDDIRENGIVPKSKIASNNSTGCYIATAVYGSYNSSEVRTLRRFRDNVLQKHWWGRVFVKTYYLVSPPIAKWLRNATSANSFVRHILDRLVYILENSQDN